METPATNAKWDVAETADPDGWGPVAGIRDVQVPATGIVLLAVGMEDREPCRVVGKQVQAFASKYDDVTTCLPELMVGVRAGVHGQLLRQDVRSCPMVVSIVVGSVAFNQAGCSFPLHERQGSNACPPTFRWFRI